MLTYMLGLPCFIYHSKLVIKSCSHHFIDKKRKPREKFLGIPGQGRALYPGTFTTTIFSTQHAAVFSRCNLNDNLKFVLRQIPLLLLYCINNKMCWKRERVRERKENKEKRPGGLFLVLLNHLVGTLPPIRRKEEGKEEERERKREGRREGEQISEIRKWRISVCFPAEISV